MRKSSDHIDEVFTNYLTGATGGGPVIFENGEMTRPELAELTESFEDIIRSLHLSTRGFIVLHGLNSPTQLAWVCAAVLNHIPFCLESDENDGLASTLLDYGDVLKVNTDTSVHKLYPARTSLRKRPSEAEWAYLVNTSGSTGIPKIIPISRSNLDSWLSAIRNAYPFDSGETWLWEHRLSFDVALWEIFGAIAFNAGLNVTSIPVANWERTQLDFARSNPSQVIILTPSEVKSLSRLAEDAVDQVLTDAHALILCGERLGWDALDCLPAWVSANKVQVYNAYGPSETTICCCRHRLSESDFSSSSVPLGETFGDTAFRIDESSGELLISGPQVFAGYLGAEEGPGAEYPTGDIVEKLEDGSIVFRGRISGYLNVNGERLDPYPTIEVLRSLSGIDDVHLWVSSNPPNDQIIAALKTDQVESINTREVRVAVRESGVRVQPTKFHCISSEQWPITKRGKLDHQTLVEKTEKELEDGRRN